MSSTIHSLAKHPMLFLGKDHDSVIRSDGVRLPFGQVELDKACQGGVPLAGLARIQTRPGCGELALLKPVLYAKSLNRKKVLWINHHFVLSPTWLANTSIFEQSWCVIPPSFQDALWTCEQAIRSQACACIILYCDNLDIKPARRLQVLSKQYDTLIIVVTPPSASGSLPVNLDVELAFCNERWFVHIHRVAGAWPQRNIPIENPLPATNSAITRAFSSYNTVPAVFNSVS